jgi:hypothetical protein
MLGRLEVPLGRATVSPLRLCCFLHIGSPSTGQRSTKSTRFTKNSVSFNPFLTEMLLRSSLSPFFLKWVRANSRKTLHTKSKTIDRFTILGEATVQHFDIDQSAQATLFLSWFSQGVYTKGLFVLDVDS